MAFIADCVVSTQEDLLRLLKNSGGVNKKLSGGVNLQDKILQEIKKKSSFAVRPRTVDIILFNKK